MVAGCPARCSALGAWSVRRPNVQSGRAPAACAAVARPKADNRQAGSAPGASDGRPIGGRGGGCSLLECWMPGSTSGGGELDQRRRDGVNCGRRSLLVVPGRVPGQLQHFGGEVLEDGGEVDRGAHGNPSLRARLPLWLVALRPSARERDGRSAAAAAGEERSVAAGAGDDQRRFAFWVLGWS
ncbi:hypothetical protein BDA96_07G168400 [Sorghum bicolor]|uniref:Uncharacterized protein n=2 Tax=Sorghum bicolor TaxID=4558 RepID=A0A921UAT9_SORBI|nr:hypothetical protein BDA96_07G168400 [Sorghum bicolor]KXG25321.1 hypothetical protein SORBI_3007G157200 [Sorghum bicolor]